MIKYGHIPCSFLTLPPPITINYFQVIVFKYSCRAYYKVYWFRLSSSLTFILIHFLFAWPENPKWKLLLPLNPSPPFSPHLWDLDRMMKLVEAFHLVAFELLQPISESLVVHSRPTPGIFWVRISLPFLLLPFKLECRRAFWVPFERIYTLKPSTLYLGLSVPFVLGASTIASWKNELFYCWKCIKELVKILIHIPTCLTPVVFPQWESLLEGLWEMS